MSTYRSEFTRSIEDPESFWLAAAEQLDWQRTPSRALDASNPPFYRWFPDGVLNTSYNALDRHVEAGHGDRAALIYDSPVTDTRATFSYQQLRDEVARFAGALTELGVARGDRVLLYMPMIPESVVAFLACARIGAVHSMVFGGFAPAELAVRIEDTAPTVIVTASCGIEGQRVVAYKPMLDAALTETEHQPQRCIIAQRPQLRAELGEIDLDWHSAVDGVLPVPPMPVAATDPLYVLYTSGTTARPKGIVRDNGGHAAALAWSMANIYDIGPGDVFWTASDVGWVVGHSYIVYAPLLVGATTVLYEGKPVGTPDAGAFWRVIADHRVKALFTAPTAIRAIKKEDPDAELAKGYDLTSLQTLFLAGERLDPDTYHWASAMLDVPVIDHWWQTETGWPVAANLRGLEPMPIKPGSPTVPVPGFDVRVLGDDLAELPAGEQGAIAIRMPLPPGTLPTLWRDDERFVSSYLSDPPDYYLTGDAGMLDEDGYLYVMGRTDDVINTAGHRLSTGAMEAVLAEHPAVAECAVIGVADEIKGQVPYGIVVPKAGVDTPAETLADELRALVRDRIGAVASFKHVSVADALPKTRSGKVLRRSMREIADGGEAAVPATIEDPGVLDQMRSLLAPRG